MICLFFGIFTYSAEHQIIFFKIILVTKYSVHPYIQLCFFLLPGSAYERGGVASHHSAKFSEFSLLLSIADSMLETTKINLKYSNSVNHSSVFHPRVWEKNGETGGYGWYM